VEATLACGNISVKNFKLAVDISLVALDNFYQSPVSLDEIQCTSGDGDNLTMDVVAELWNPSQISALLDGNFCFDFILNNTKVGLAHLKSFYLRRGISKLAAEAVLQRNDENHGAIQAFIYNYIVASPSPLLMLGHGNSTDIPVLQPLFSNISLPLLFVPKMTQFVQRVSITVLLLKLDYSATITILNPLPVRMWLRGVNMGVFYETPSTGAQTQIYQMNAQFGEPNHGAKLIEANQPGGATFNLPLAASDIFWSNLWQAIGVVRSAFSGSVLVNLEGEVDLIIEPSFFENLSYTGHNITATIEVHLW